MANRCKATEGAQQCLQAQHSKVRNHTWGPKGETKEWNADGTPRTAADADTDVIERPWADAFNGDHDPDRDALEAEAAAIAARHPDILPELPAPPPPPSAAMGPGHSIADVATNDTIDTLLFDDLDPQLKFEKVWTRIAANTLLRITAEYHRYGKVADLGLVMAMRDHIDQLVANRAKGGGS